MTHAEEYFCIGICCTWTRFCSKFPKNFYGKAENDDEDKIASYQKVCYFYSHYVLESDKIYRREMESTKTMEILDKIPELLTVLVMLKLLL